MTPARAIPWALIALALAPALAGCGQAAEAGTRQTPVASIPASTLTAPTAPSITTPTVISQPCFGAVARAPDHSCASAASRLAVVPTPAVAATTPNAPCDGAHSEGPLYICSFGVKPAKAKRTIALIGDSHAAMWRAALAPIARAEGWHGVSIVHPGCPFSALTREIGGAQRDASCTTWRKAIIPWLTRHPEVSALFVGGLSNSPFIHPPGEPNFAAAVRGYQQVWQELPPAIQHVVVMRDTPRFGFNNLACVDRAIAAHLEAGIVCATPRSIALPPDPELSAAVGMNSPRFQSIDVNSEICSTNYCYPVVGSALVLKDFTHMTRTFAATLAPAVMSRLQQLTRTWGEATPGSAATGPATTARATRRWRQLITRREGRETHLHR